MARRAARTRVARMNDEALLHNHLAFLRRHRGEIATTAGGYAIQSTRAEFTYDIALRDGTIDAGIEVVHRPEIGDATAAQLEAQGFRRVGALRYMTRTTTGACLAAPADVGVRIASTPADADVFAEVQTRGFFDREDDQKKWLPFMREVARRNVGDPDQAFFIGQLGDVAAGVTLMVRTDVVGIYAVATPSAFRKRGVATALLDAALRRAADGGVSIATLQVVAGSDAERLYSRLGFTPRFTTEIWRREQVTSGT